jgi:hypothetical protein
MRTAHAEDGWRSSSALSARIPTTSKSAPAAVLKLIRESTVPVDVDWVVFSALPKREAEARGAPPFFLKGARRKRVRVEHFRT